MVDFSDFIGKHTQDFIGREWVFNAINDWLANQTTRIFFLTGGPGTGKTAIAARLVQMNRGEFSTSGYCQLGKGFLTFHHFCIANDDRTLSPLRFIESLSQSFANRYQLFREALFKLDKRDIHITTNQEIGSVSEGATISGVRIEKLTILNMPLRVAFDMTIRQPLEQLVLEDKNKPLIILVDSLDEALTLGKENICTLLAEILGQQSGFGANIRFILTSRPDERVLYQFDDLQRFDLITDAEDSIYDVKQYSLYRLRPLPEPQRSALATKVAIASEGQFLYANYVITDLLNNLVPLEELDTLNLPKNLQDHYRWFLKRELAKDVDSWDEDYAPIMSLLAIARGDGLSLKHFEGVTGKPINQIRRLLRICSQFLHGEISKSVRIYHHSFRTFLLNLSEDLEFTLDIVAAHGRLATYFINDHAKSDEDVYTEPYSLAHLPFHLHSASHKGDLETLLLNFNWLLSKMSRLGIQSLLSDFEYTSSYQTLLVRNALRLSINAIGSDPSQLAGQLLGRLQDLAEPGIQKLLEQAKQFRGQEIWLRPLTSSLISPAEDFPLVSTFTGHQDIILCVALSTDGTIAASSSQDGELIIWDVKTGERKTSFQNVGVTSSLSINRNGQFLIIYPGENSVVYQEAAKLKIVDIVQTQELAFPFLSTPITEFKAASFFTTSDRILLIAESQITVVNLLNREIETAFEVDEGIIVSASVAADESTVTLITRSGIIYRYDLRLRAAQKISTGIEPVYAGCVSANGEWAAFASEKAIYVVDSLNKVWQVKEQLWSESENKFEYTRLSLSPNGMWLAIFNPRREVVEVWNLPRREKTCHIGEDQIWPIITDIAYLPDNNLITVDTNSRLKIWRMETGDNLLTFKAHSSNILSVAVDQQGLRAITGSIDHTAKLWDIPKALSAPSSKIDVNPIYSLAVSNRHIVTRSGGRIVILDMNTLEPKLVFQHKIDSKYSSDAGGSVGIAQDGSYFLARVDALYLLGEMDTIPTLSTLSSQTTKHQISWPLIAISRDNRFGVIIGFSDGIEVCDLQQKSVESIDGSIVGRAMMVSPALDAPHSFYLLTEEGAVYRLDVLTKSATEVIPPDPNEYYFEGVLTPDLHVLAMTYYGFDDNFDIVLKTKNLDRNKYLTSLLHRHTRRVSGLAVTNNQEFLASTSLDLTIRLWSTKRAELITTFTCDFEAESCAFSQDDKTLIVGDAAGNLHFLRLEQHFEL